MKNHWKNIDRLGQIPRDNEGPIFSEPWEAQAFALAVGLSGLGYFSWDEWATVLGEEIDKAQADGDPDLGDTYYEHWVTALERLCSEKGLIGFESMGQRKAEWRLAYLNTPHGQPIELSAAFYNGLGMRS